MPSAQIAPETSVYLFPIASSLVVGLCGIFPLVIIPTELTEHLQSKAGSRKLNRLLSFGIGSMLGDVFLHLLPEAYAQHDSVHGPILGSVGFWTIVGVLSFFMIEKLLVFADLGGSGGGGDGSDKKQKKVNVDSNDSDVTSAVQVEGYLNLFANFVDNLTHGLAVGSSYAVSVKVGLLTTFCILVHEIPHEISDFAILLRAGFHKWRAAKAQLLTASGSLVGALFAFSAGQTASSASVSVVLPFTSGGFLYLALASLTPPILEEADRRESLVQVVCMLVGFASLYLVSFYL